MKKVITYGTFDMLHYGHIRLLERAKGLGTYLIVAVTSDDYDKARGKIDVQQPLIERVAAIRATGLADRIIVEEYEGQKIDDVRRYGIDIFTVGSDWTGAFDYLNEYCKVVYLPRTEGISSSSIRRSENPIRVGMVGYSPFLRKFYKESRWINAVRVSSLCVPSKPVLCDLGDDLSLYTSDYDQMLDAVDAVYLHSRPGLHYDECRRAFEKGKHVLCESPVAMSVREYEELKDLAKQNQCVFMEAIRTAYITAYARMLLIVKSGRIGEVVSVDATCTSLSSEESPDRQQVWGALEAWGPTTLLPVFQLLGTSYLDCGFFSRREKTGRDFFTKISFSYQDATATIKAGNGVKSEGELVVSGTKGYVYVPAPWWKTDYFEVRYENPAENKRYFYSAEGEGIRTELLEMSNAIKDGQANFYISESVTQEIVKVMEAFRGLQS